jgi:competence protein ComEA
VPEPVEDPAPVVLPVASTWRDRMDLLVDGGRNLPPLRWALGAVGVVGVALLGWLLLRDPPAPVEASLPRARAAEAGGATSTTAPPVVVAHAAGAVAHPGLYRLAKGSRVDDLLRAAGGPLDDADLDRVNLAAPLTDGAQVQVPHRGEPGTEVGAVSAGAAFGPVDLNTATVAQLDALPGVGPSTAAAIVAARTRRGRFQRVDDLLDVRGIGPAKLDALRDLVTV